MKIGNWLINVRADTASSMPSFKSRRCLMSVGQFCEWRKLDAKRKQPFNVSWNSGTILTT